MQDVSPQMMKELEAIGHRMAKQMEKQLERQRTKWFVLFYGCLFLLCAWVVSNPVWSWMVLGVGVIMWGIFKVFLPIHVQMMGVTVRQIEHDDNS